MTSKERVKRAIHFQYPDRIPVHLPAPYASDIEWVFPKSESIRQWTQEGETYRLGEWGSVWHVISEENMGEVVQPALPDWSSIESYVLPDINNAERYAHVPDTLAEHSDKYCMGVLSCSLFPHYWEIRGLMGFFEDLNENVEQMERLLDQIMALQLRSVDLWAKLGVDGIVVGFDDWGLQHSLMINPVLWRRYFKPRYKIVWDHIHSHGMDVILHSCGDILSIMEDMIEIGLNVINMDQQQNMGLDVLSEKLKGKICFWNPADIQTVLIDQTPNQIRDYVRQMILALSDQSGGFIGKYYPQPAAAGHSPERTMASFDAFVEFGAIHGVRSR